LPYATFIDIFLPKKFKIADQGLVLQDYTRSVRNVVVGCVPWSSACCIEYLNHVLKNTTILAINGIPIHSTHEV